MHEKCDGRKVRKEIILKNFEVTFIRRPPGWNLTTIY